MGSKHSYLQLVTAIAVASSLILSACQMRDQSVVGRFAGGGHGDGGNNAAEKTLPGRTTLTPELKALITDPTTLAFYKTNLEPFLDKLTKQSTFPWASLLNLKIWLLGSMNLDKMPGQTMAMTYSNLTAEPLSRQTQYEVWIDGDQAKQMSDGDKADLLLNELLTDIYLMRNLSDSEMCKLVMATYPLTPRCQFNTSSDEETAKADTDVKKDQKKNKLGKRAILQKMMMERISSSSRPRTPLTQQDANSIRVVKNYIHQQGDKLTYKELITKMGEFGFDLRIFSVKINPTKPKAGEALAENDSATLDDTLSAAAEQEPAAEELNTQNAQ
jgi:hypothetical protein